MGSPHLDERAVESYRQRTMTPAELLSVNEHAFSCDICHRRLVGAGPVANTYRFVKEELEAAAREDDEHLRFEQIVDYATGQLDEADREILETHIEACPDCDAEVADVRLFSAAVSLKPAPGPAPVQERRRGWAWLEWKPLYWIPVQIAAMIVVAIFVARWATSPLTSRADRLTAEIERLRADRDSLGHQPGEQAGGASDIASRLAQLEQEMHGRWRPVTPNTAGAAPAITLRDGGRAVRLSSEGTLESGGLIPAEYVPLVRTALKSGRIAAKAVSPGPLGSQTRSASENDAFQLLTPVGVTSLSDQPLFRWMALKDARSYSVVARDAASDWEIESGSLLEPEWAPNKPFERGRSYSWAVVATLKDGERVYVPGPRSPAAVFTVLAKAASEELERAKAMSKRSHILLAVLYAQQGLLTEAHHELKVLQAENPNSDIVARLQRSLKR
jgi:anti-sigma factor RsiW